ncbi:MAG: 1,2-phenylacetyl-CoA epoxidase subunit PaaE [Pseudomonadota bacterium]
MASKFYTLKIAAVQQETTDAVSITFDVPSKLAETFYFIPGQYLTLRAQIDGADIRRSYSICAPLGGRLRVGIKTVESGVFSTFAQTLKPGDTLQVMPPEGRFTCDCISTQKRDLLLIASGSGITPILSIARSVLEVEPESRVTLIYGNRQTASIMFLEEVEDLKDRFLSRFHIYHILSREAQDVDIFHGRIDPERIDGLMHRGIIDPNSADGIFLCGPSEMSLSLSEHFKTFGIEANKIYTELFELPGEGKPVIISEEIKAAADSGVSIEVILDGIHRKFNLNDVEDTILSAAEKSGLDLPFSCAGGMCATCRCKVVEGAVKMDRNFSLDDWEVDAGYVLACQSRPKTETLILDFDAA